MRPAALVLVLACGCTSADPPGVSISIQPGDQGGAGGELGAGGEPMASGSSTGVGGQGGELLAGGASNSGGSDGGTGGEPACQPVADGDPCTIDGCNDAGPVYEQVVTPALCGARCIPTQITTPHTMCSGTATESEAGAKFLGVLWWDPKTNLPDDDQLHRCGTPELTSAPGCGCGNGEAIPLGTCQPGWPCDVVRELPNGDVQYIGGVCG